jgi:hypothetical protein
LPIAIIFFITTLHAERFLAFSIDDIAIFTLSLFRHCLSLSRFHFISRRLRLPPLFFADAIDFAY